MSFIYANSVMNFLWLVLVGPFFRQSRFFSPGFIIINSAEGCRVFPEECEFLSSAESRKASYGDSGWLKRAFQGGCPPKPVNSVGWVKTPLISGWNNSTLWGAIYNANYLPLVKKPLVRTLLLMNGGTFLQLLWEDGNPLPKMNRKRLNFFQGELRK